MNNIIENWKLIEGHDGYAISNLGSIINQHGKEIKGGINSSGWRQVCLMNDGKKSWLKVHLLVAHHFIPNPNGWHGVYIMRKKTDCTTTNLRWCANHKDKAKSREYLLNHYKQFDTSDWDKRKKSMLLYFQTGDSKHIAGIFEDYYKIWYGSLLKMAQDENNAQDILQDSYEAFTECINSGRFRIDDCYVGHAADVYVKRIVRNAFTNWKRKQSKVTLIGEHYDRQENYI